MEKNQFLSYISHELRTPLNGISGMIQLLQMTKLDEEQQEYLQVLKVASNRMNHLINNLMHYSLLFGKNTYKSAYKCVVLKDLFRQLLESLKIDLLDKQMTVEISISPTVSGEICIDAFGLEIALGQLIDNAIQHSRNGQISINASTHEQQSNCLTIEVTDEGPGFDVCYYDRIVPEQAEVADLDNNYDKHLGLGLKIVKKACGNALFHCWFESKLGFGTKAIIEIPFIEAGSFEETHEETAENGSQKKVLIVDDDENGRVLLALLCRKMGMLCDLALDGETALEMGRKKHYDLIFLDIQMPIMNGLEVLKRLRETPHHQEVPILAVTAYALKGDEEHFLAEGFDGYLSKPIEFNRFEHLTRRVLQMHF